MYNGPKLTKNQLIRFPQYLTFFKKCNDAGIKYMNSKMIADALSFNDEQVRKDLQIISTVSGIPNRGREIKRLIADIERLLGYGSTNYAVIVGCGSLGKALLNYRGFEEYGLKIIAGFAKNCGNGIKKINNIPLYDSKNMDSVIKELNVHIGIICVQPFYAQDIANQLVDSGIEAIWNFSSTNLKVPSSIIVSNMDMAISLAELSHKLYMQKLKQKDNNK